MREGFGLLGGEVGEVEPGEDEAVEIAYGADLGADFVGEVDGEGFFGAEDDFYGV